MTSMKTCLCAVLLVLAPLAAAAQQATSVPAAAAPDAPAAPAVNESVEDSVFWTGETPDLDSFLWEKRPVVVFADTPNDPQYRRQIENLEERPAELLDRDVIVLTDTDPAASGPLRRKLRPRGFNVVLIDKNGQVTLRKPQPLTVRELSATIDKTPLRRQELQERRLLQ
ncbi:DUF4174 domain-containing protein [Pseudooceanicola nanhaiensis]|uniref:DUF4174 domain-containing protein n=1 Tax=Pseudooceanicola nanhaiensis TaxID=375761 RepID=UPI001CD5C3FC|nr:DUF4174 domain-containing protein [Pseudooceanicola nanhaiensis]MCA0919524.1 DUF4174 domain-containing protein [Pseudooceanicola nanhaiensis]